MQNRASPLPQESKYYKVAFQSYETKTSKAHLWGHCPWEVMLSAKGWSSSLWHPWGVAWCALHQSGCLKLGRRPGAVPGSQGGQSWGWVKQLQCPALCPPSCSQAERGCQCLQDNRGKQMRTQRWAQLSTYHSTLPPFPSPPVCIVPTGSLCLEAASFWILGETTWILLSILVHKASQ